MILGVWVHHSVKCLWLSIVNERLKVLNARNPCVCICFLIPFASTIYFPQADNEHRQQVATRAAAPPPRPQVAEDRGAGMPRRRRRGMHAAMEARRPQREASDEGMQCFHVCLLSTCATFYQEMKTSETYEF